MFKLDDNLLIELGLGSLPPSEKNRMLGHIYETLEMRVGMKLAQQMTNEQLDEFEAFINRNDEAGALKWLETNFPNYKQVVADELQTLKTEIKAAAPQIVAASQQSAAAMQPMSPVAPSPQPAQQVNYSPQSILPSAPLQQSPQNTQSQQPPIGGGQMYNSPAVASSYSPIPSAPTSAVDSSIQQPMVQSQPIQSQYPAASAQQAAQPDVSPQPQYPAPMVPPLSTGTPPPSTPLSQQVTPEPVTSTVVDNNAIQQSDAVPPSSISNPPQYPSV